MRAADLVNVSLHRYGMSVLLLRLGSLLPALLKGEELISASRNVEQMCWRELGYKKMPVFAGDLPNFLGRDGDGNQVELSMPKAPAVLAGCFEKIRRPSPVAGSRVATNFDSIARLLELTLFEFQWLLSSYCVQRFGKAILPVIPLRDATHGCYVLALLYEMPVAAVLDTVASRRLYAWGFLGGISTEGEMPPLLSGWLSATDQFADWIEQPYASDSDLLTALCQAQASLKASR